MLLHATLILGLFVLFPEPAFAGKEFGAWLEGVRVEARANGISEKIIATALPQTLRPIPRIIELDRKQPEKAITFERYFTNVVTKDRIAKGRRLLRENKVLLSEISNTYGVPAEVIVALWGIETNFGENMGGFLVVDALATLAHDPRRSAYFRSELMKALRILNEGHVSAVKMKGSWAGAMGQCQFMPSSFLRFAVDYNGDNHKDIWGTRADVFASAAKYLSDSGWRRDGGVLEEVSLPKSFNTKLIGLEVKNSLQVWAAKGVTLVNKKPLNPHSTQMASIVRPKGSGGRAFIVYGNYKTIMLWNNSVYFATAVGLLANSIALDAK